jgi:hypothetical protein
MKNKLPDLNNHLFAQLERLTEEGLSTERIEEEVKRAGAVVSLSDQIVSGMKLHLDAAKLVAVQGDRFMKQLPMLTGGAADAG